jgi:hypothetical protein
MGASALAPCHLEKQNDPAIHYSLCQQEANYASILPQSAPGHDAERQNSHSNQQSNPLFISTVRFGSKTAAKMSKKCDQGDAGALRAGFSLILGLVLCN